VRVFKGGGTRIKFTLVLGLLHDTHLFVCLSFLVSRGKGVILYTRSRATLDHAFAN